MGLEIFAFHKEKWLAFFLQPFLWLPPGSSQFFCYFLYLPKVVQFRKVGKEYIQVWRMWTWPKGGNFHLLLFLPPSSLKVFLGKSEARLALGLLQGLFLLLSKVIFFVEHLIFIKSYYRGCLLFTEARPFGPMMVKIIPRLFINTIFNCPWNIKIHRKWRKYIEKNEEKMQLRSFCYQF